jgi:hypothetical protein
MSIRRKLTTVVLIAVLAGCATPYQKDSPWNAVIGGYTDYRLDESTFVVSFRIGNQTPVANLLPYLLYRAAEVSNGAGFEFFQIVDSAQDVKTGTAALPGYSQSQGSAVAFGSGGIVQAYGSSQTFTVPPQLLTYRENTLIATVKGFRNVKPEGAAVYSAKDVLRYLGPQVHNQ